MTMATAHEARRDVPRWDDEMRERRQHVAQRVARWIEREVALNPRGDLWRIAIDGTDHRQPSLRLVIEPGLLETVTELVATGLREMTEEDFDDDGA